MGGCKQRSTTFIREQARPATCDLDGGGVRSTEEQSPASRNCLCSTGQNIGSRTKPNIFLRCWSWAAVGGFESSITTTITFYLLPITASDICGLGWHSMACRDAVEAKPSPWRRDKTADAELAHRTGPSEAPARLAVRSREPKRERDPTRHSLYHSTSDALPALLQHGTCLPATVS
jgi:hypothetical protein